MKAVARLLASAYGLPDARIERFSPDHPAYLATTSSGRQVVRIGHNLEHHAAALRALEAAGYPAPRVLPASNGAFIGKLADDADGRSAMVLTFVEGSTPEFSCAHLRLVGQALGHLHRHGRAIAKAASQPDNGLPVIERAGMLPANELRFGLRQLLPAEQHLPNRETTSQWRTLVDACEAGLRPIAGLTQTFLHGDAHPWNSIIGPAGAHYIDWDSAGPGPAIIDLAFLVVSCATGGLVYPYQATDSAAVNALLDGYGSEMTLSSRDLDALESAVAFRVLVCAAVGFGHHLQQGEDPMAEPGIQWSLRRLREAPRIADTIRLGLSR